MSESIDDDNDDNVEEEDRPKKKSKKTDFLKVGGNILTNINYKVAFLLFVVSMIIFSDTFIENVIYKFNGTNNGACTTTKGTLLQLTFMVISYIILDLIVKYDLL
jgi:hypothetical protein